MISASLAVEGPARNLGLTGPGGHSHHHSHYYLQPPLPPPPQSIHSQPSIVSQSAAHIHKPAEFLRPLPKPLTRHNGTTVSSIGPNSNLNGLRSNNIISRNSPKYSPPSHTTTNASNNNNSPVNLTHSNNSDTSTFSTTSLPIPRSPPQEDLYPIAGTTYPRLYPHPHPGFVYPYGSIYPPYTPILTRQLDQNPYIPVSSSFSPPVLSPNNSSTVVKPPLKERRTSVPVNFKVPSGKEGSLKHRILTRPVEIKKKTIQTNNNTIPGGFTKGSLIQLANGELRRIEDMRTEDFVLSAEHCPELRLANSTVVRIEENPILGTAVITLSYNQNKTQVEFESSLEHPYFVYGQGWASCAPERTLQCYSLKCYRLQVGDVCVSFTPRETISTVTNKNATITTTATTTAMTPRQISLKTSNSIVHNFTNSTVTPNVPHNVHNLTSNMQGLPGTYNFSYHRSANLNHQMHPPRTHSAEEVAKIEANNARKRRWSAPDQISEEEELNASRKPKE